MTDHATRARSILARLYFYGPEYWTGETDEAGLREKAQRQQEAIDAIAAALDQAAQPVWSTNKPTVAGGYWRRDGPDDETPFPALVYDDGNDGLECNGVNVLDMGGEWAGPLPLPKEA